MSRRAESNAIPSEPPLLVLPTVRGRGSARQVPRRPTVCVADDDQPTRRIFSRALAGAYRVCPAVESIDELEAVLEVKRVQAVLLDLIFRDDVSVMPLLPGLCARFPDVCFVLHTGFPSRASVYQALASGARGYLIKGEGSGLSEVLLAFETVLHGGIYLTLGARNWLNEAAQEAQCLS